MEPPTSILSYIFIFFYSFNVIIAEFSNDDCTSLGFNKANLLCSVCDQLAEFRLEILK